MTAAGVNRPDAHLATEVARLKWFHSIDLGNGIITPGVTPINVLRAQADIYFADNLVKDKAVLDIGCWDGFNSFEAARRGAKRVLATDHFVWAKGPGDRASFELARAHLAAEVEVLDIDIFTLTPERVGTFDIVLLLGVFYHLRHPLLAMEQVARLAKEAIVLETRLDAFEETRPAMIFYPTNELNNDPSNWWGPNRACMEAILHDVGFPHIEFTRHPIHKLRGIFRAYRN